MPKLASLSMRLKHFLSNSTLSGLLSGMLWSLNCEAIRRTDGERSDCLGRALKLAIKGDFFSEKGNPKGGQVLSLPGEASVRRHFVHSSLHPSSDCIWSERFWSPVAEARRKESKNRLLALKREHWKSKSGSILELRKQKAGTARLK